MKFTNSENTGSENSNIETENVVEMPPIIHDNNFREDRNLIITE